jgi:hypothetical protein
MPRGPTLRRLVGGLSLSAGWPVLSAGWLVLSAGGLGCAPFPAGAPELPGSGGGALGATPADTGVDPLVWRGYDAATVAVAGVSVCDRVWDTTGEGSDIPCVDCALAVSVRATVRGDVGGGQDCPSESYENDYAWRPSSTDESLPIGLLAHQPGGWVWIGEAALDGDLLVGNGSFTDGDRVTLFTVVGSLSAP